MLDRCFLIQKQAPVFVVLGRHGDLILLLPAFMEIKQRIGMNPIVYVSKNYASVLGGVSYVDSVVVDVDWYQGVPKARAMAEKDHGGAVVPAWWDDPQTAYDVAGEIHENGAMVLQSHGRQWGVNCAENPDFGTSMWRRAGFTRKEMLSLPLVFDKRNKIREADLVKCFNRSGKPMVLYNFKGQSSPFGYVPETLRMLQPYRQLFNMVDLGEIRASRVYDLLGLYDKAVGLITIDTATAHLAPASNVPTVWLTVPGWGRSVPRGNVACHVPYNEIPKRMSEIRTAVESWVPK